MAGVRAQVNKSHKTRFASKSSRNVHQIPVKEKSKIAKSAQNAGKVGRASRLQHNKMLREQKQAAILKEKRASSGTMSPPRVIVLFGLSESVNLDVLEKDMVSLLAGEGNGTAFPAVASAKYKLRTTVLKAPHGDLPGCMEMAKVADLIAFVACASSSLSDQHSDHPYIDPFGSQCLSVFRTIGLPSTVVLLRDLPDETERRHDIKKRCISKLTSQFPEDCKFYTADTQGELHKFIWLFREQRLTVPHWRNQHPYLMSQKVSLVSEESSLGKCTLLLTGYLRARNLSVNQLVHVAGAGDYQLSKIELLKDPCPLSVRKGDVMDSDDIYNEQVVRCLMPDPMKQESLVVENTPDPLAGEQTSPTEAEMAEADKCRQGKQRKRRVLPPGTSEYQATWIVDESDTDYSGSDEDGAHGMVPDGNENYFVGQEGCNECELDDDQGSLKLKGCVEEMEMDSEDENLTKEQIEEEINKIKAAHAKDEEHPDEVDTPKNARKRFAKYRGLKSFRNSSWDPKESLPSDYARIFAFDNLARTQKHVLAEALELDVGHLDECVPPGSYVRLYVKDVSADVASRLCKLSKTMPIVSCGLLQHESKISVLHFSVKSMYTNPIKSKEELLFHVGFRQFMTRPIFSEDSMNNDKHKMERFLRPGTFSIASIYAPICFPPLPLIVLKSDGEFASPAVAAVGSLRSIDPDRIILKKIILTGYPRPVSKNKSYVHCMFRSPKDVRRFKQVELWTKCGLQGHITKPVGTLGSMKCEFKGKSDLQQHDTVCMSLYKRSFPKWPQHWFPIGA